MLQYAGTPMKALLQQQPAIHCVLPVLYLGTYLSTLKLIQKSLNLLTEYNYQITKQEADHLARALRHNPQLHVNVLDNIYLLTTITKHPTTKSHL